MWALLSALYGAGVSARWRAFAGAKGRPNELFNASAGGFGAGGSAGWFERRLTYTSSLAVSSMVGHIMGIGDRHTQNILIDTRTAEVRRRVVVTVTGSVFFFFLLVFAVIHSEPEVSRAVRSSYGGRFEAAASMTVCRLARVGGAQVVHIDFGIVFEQGRTLSTPETVFDPPPPPPTNPPAIQFEIQ